MFEARFVNLVYDPHGNIGGFSVAYPDYFDAIRAMHVKHDLWTTLEFRFHRSKVDRAVFYMIGATPEEIEKRHGVGGATYYHTVRQILSAGFNSVLFAIIATIVADANISTQRCASHKRATHCINLIADEPHTVLGSRDYSRESQTSV